MSGCETCWADANREALMTGAEVVEVYRRLLQERVNNPCGTTETEGAS